MGVQKKIYGTQVPGILGEFSDDSVKSARAYLCFGKDGPAAPESQNLPGFGKFFSFGSVTVDASTGATKTVAVQGVAANGVALGILVNPKEHVIVGFKTGRTMFQNGVNGTIADRGHIWVFANAPTTAGGDVYTDVDGNTLVSGATKVEGAKWLKTSDVSEYADFDAAKTYAVGDKVKYNDEYYTCNTAITVAAAWDATKWTKKTEWLSEIAINTPEIFDAGEGSDEG